jgi:hypothetical protein
MEMASIANEDIMKISPTRHRGGRERVDLLNDFFV